MRVAMLWEQLMQKVPGGTSRYTMELGTALASTGEDGDTVTSWIALHRDAPTSAVSPAGSVPTRKMALPRPVLAELWARTRLPGTGPRGADVIFAPTPFAPPRTSTPLVVAIHDAVPWTEPETMSPRGLRWHRQIIAARAEDADAIVVPTKAVADALAQHLPTLNQDRVHVTGEGVSAAVTTVPADDAVRAEKLQLPQRYLLLVGTLEPRKGLDVALRALADDRTGELPLIVVGAKGWGGVDVLEEAQAYGLATGRVRVLGQVSDADLATAYSRATAVLVPSRDEGFGLPAVEALAHGVPILISSCPALVEVTGEASIVTPVGDRVALALAITEVNGWDDDKRAEYAARAKAQAAKHTWAAVANATWAVLRNACDDSGA